MFKIIYLFHQNLHAETAHVTQYIVVLCGHELSSLRWDLSMGKFGLELCTHVIGLFRLELGHVHRPPEKAIISLFGSEMGT